jgi:Fe-S cluster assembly iron-binding protein IscA
MVRLSEQCPYMFSPNYATEVEVTLRLTVSQPECQGFEPTLELVTRYYFLSEDCCLRVAVLSQWGAL